MFNDIIKQIIAQTNKMFIGNITGISNIIGLTFSISILKRCRKYPVSFSKKTEYGIWYFTNVFYTV